MTGSLLFIQLQRKVLTPNKLHSYILLSGHVWASFSGHVWASFSVFTVAFFLVVVDINGT
jgi:hypothetical protein